MNVVKRGDLELGKIETFAEHVDTYDDSGVTGSQGSKSRLFVTVAKLIVNERWIEVRGHLLVDIVNFLCPRD